MTRRLRGPCAEPGCPVLTTDTRCGRHRRQTGRSAGWPYLRRVVLSERRQCEHCGAPSVEADHVVPVADGGAELDADNVQALCRACHASKTAAEA